jgi:hypothetical protein
MSAEAVAVSRTFQVGRYTATVSLPRLPVGGTGCAVIGWSPCMPDRLSPAELEQYRRGRDAAIHALGLMPANREKP